MKIIKLRNSPRTSIIAVLLTSITMAGCDSDNNSAELARAAELESLRAQGTIIDSVTIVGVQTRLKAGEIHQLSATGIDSNNDMRDITNELTWSSSDTSIAVVNSKGLVTAVANSMVNQGIITITGTTINDISGEVEMSISDVAVTTIRLKQTSPTTGGVYTCIDASIKGDVDYEDGYTSLNTVKGMSFTLDDNSSARIDTDGSLYTSSEAIEDIIITAKIADISGLLTVTADPKYLENLDILLDDKTTTLITLNIGDRVQVSGQASLLAEVSNDDFIIDNSISWSQVDVGHTGITTIGDNKGTIFALKPGTTQLIGTCGGKQAIAIIEVEGEADLDAIQINDGSDTITLAPLESVELTLTASYSTTQPSLNVSEFAQWSINGSNLLDVELIALGTDKASYKLTSTSNINGVVIVSATYDGITTSALISIE